MAVTLTTIQTNLGARIVVDLDANATSEDDVRGGATTLYRIRIDNSANTSATYVKLYDATSATVGTTAPFMIIRAAASKIIKVATGLGQGISFGTGLSIAAVTAGGTAGTTAPSSAVGIKLHTA